MGGEWARGWLSSMLALLTRWHSCGDVARMWMGGDEGDAGAGSCGFSGWLQVGWGADVAAE